MKYAYVRSKR